ncbi:MAG: isocitrate lyase/phosphoenolpyruvate mutase family protein [Pseudomonadota bacterium]
MQPPDTSTPSDASRDTTLRPTRRLKALLATRSALLIPGTANALFARVIDDLGFDALYVTGAGIANMHVGVPDIGLVSLKEVADVTATIADVTARPIIVDADTGFGNALNMVRTVQMLERAGASALQIEDQVFPKKCGHFSGKAVVATQDMVAKIKAAVDTRRDGDLQIIARTDARAIHGLDEALARAHAYIEAGADVTFVEAPTSLEEMAQITAALPVPQIANMVHGGLTPDPGRDALAAMGFAGVLYANAALQAALQSVGHVLASLKREGSLAAVSDHLADFEMRQRAVGKPAFDALDERYKV